MDDHYRAQGQTMDRLADNNAIPIEDPEKSEPPPPENILAIAGFNIDVERLKSVCGIIRGLNCALLLIMFVCAIAGKGAAGAFKFQIFCWVLFTPMVVFFVLKDFAVEPPPKMIGSLEFSFVRTVAFGGSMVLVLIGSLAAWSKNEGKGALQAAGAFGTLAGITLGASCFFAFQMHKDLKDEEPPPEEKEPEEKKEETGNAGGAGNGSGGGNGGGGGRNGRPGRDPSREPGGPPINRSSKPNTVSGGAEFDDLHGQQSMAYRVRDINDMSMGAEPPVHERTGFNTLSSRHNIRDLEAGERIGYRGQTQYNEQYDNEEPHILDNPQPLAGLTHRQQELDLNVQDLGGNMDPYGALGMGHDHYGGAHDAYGGTLGPEMNTLPRDMTLDAHTAMEYKYDTSRRYDAG